VRANGNRQKLKVTTARRLLTNQIAALHNDKLVDKCAKARFFADFFFDTPFFLFSCLAPALP
jgi:hypothetical protein